MKWIHAKFHNYKADRSKNRVGKLGGSCQRGDMNSYERIAKAIRFLVEHRESQPDLATVAAELGMSTAHFHRMFRAWAGATPKDFLQCLTLSHAKHLLREGEDVLTSALESGLSGPGRLHDLCVSLEAATPGEIKAQGAGLKIQIGVVLSPFGNCLIGETSRGICHLSFFEGENYELALGELRVDWPKAQLEWSEQIKNERAAQIFTTAFRHAPLKLYVKGTSFQLQVWRALLKVQRGTLVSYGKLAAAAGHPTSHRATGTAVGRNAISYLIPCHRVIRETGISGNYRWGAVRKRAILAWENCQRDGIC